MELTTERLRLRPFVPDDAEEFARAVRESAPDMTRWMPWCNAAYTKSEAYHWFRLCSASLAEGTGYEFGLFSAGTGRLLGGAGLNFFHPEHNFCNLGYWLRASARGQGLAAEVVPALARFGFSRLGLTRIEIVIAEGNQASIATARRAGALFEGRARNRLLMAGVPVDALVFSLIP
ncbi:GNAT family N-acetyltransferase [Verticiella sediminum]|uniref:GNAT family N-acetyltransferase n=1 Tax=Verticiella sediminum TaxID=1247510 RepID=A0A556AJN2_9BURK|nr:GNAT family N-acetyltransferase [Verticiella sediminum]TSH93114.1 GNAT family N-acetyltransferase [Verticiella sediminum]